MAKGHCERYAVRGDAVEAGGGNRFALAVLGDPNAKHFGTRRRTIRLKNNPPDYFSSRRIPSQASTPHRIEKGGHPVWDDRLFWWRRPVTIHSHAQTYMDMEAIPGAGGVDSKEIHS